MGNDLPIGCRLKLQAHYDSLKSAERKAADFLKTNPSFVGSFTIAQCAKAAGCSEPTFVRLARRLGYSGFADLKSDINSAESASEAPRYLSGDGEDTLESALNRVFGLAVQALNDTVKIIDYAEYKRALDILARAKRVCFAGIGDAAAVAMAAHIKFLRLGYESQCITDPDVMLMSASNFGEGDVFVLISHSGRTKCIVNVAKLLFKSPATVLSITNYPMTPLAKKSHICLYTSAFVEELNGEVMANRAVGLCLIESLFINLAGLRPQLVKNMLKCGQAVRVNKITQKINSLYDD